MLTDLKLQSPAQKTHESVFDRYLASLESVQDFARAFDIEVQRWQGTSRFSGFSPDKQAQVLNGLQNFLTLCVSAVQKNTEYRQENHAMAWSAIRDLNLRPPSDFFSQLQKNDVIEIYNAEHIQMFRSFNFFRGTSYSLDEIYTYEWWELYQRDQAITQMMFSLVKTIMEDAQPNRIYLSPFPKHTVREIFSSKKIIAEIESRVAAPLYNKFGKVGGYVNAFEILSLKKSH